MEAAQNANADNGSCLTCKHVVSWGTRGECPKYDGRTVRALGGCLDLGTVVYYEFDTRLGLFKDPNKETQNGNATKTPERG